MTGSGPVPGDDPAIWTDQVPLDGRGPLYEQIKRTLTANIRSGLWPAGHRLPPEHVLARHFDAARMTVHRALREMTDEGLVVRRRRVGTFVAAPPAPAALLEIVDMSAAIPASGRRYGYELLSQVTTRARGRVAELLGVAPDTPVRHVRCRHTADGEVVELEERWINLEVIPEAAERDFAAQGPGSWLLEAAPWTEAEHTVSAVNADGPLARLLDADPGAACLVLDRRTFQGEEVVTFARLTHPGDRHRMTGRFRPGG